eukprot:Em0001g956a
MPFLPAEENDGMDECAEPRFGEAPSYDIPSCPEELQAVVDEYRQLFSTVPGSTDLAHHTIPTASSPSAQYREEIERQLQEMLDRNIIRVSSSPWLAPAVYVPKKSGELRICIDYRELNKRTMKYAYPLPLPDEVQDRLAGAWQLPVQEEYRLKTAFCPGPGMGLEGRPVKLDLTSCNTWAISSPKMVWLQDCCRAELAYTNRHHRAVEFNLEENCQQPFQVLKDALSQVPVLCYPCFKKGFTIQTDASAVGMGSVLEQEGHVIAYASRSLTPPERQYSVIKWECLAVVAVKHFRHSLLGRPFSLHTDHQALQWLEGMFCRWALAVQEFDFEIKYKRESSNANADTLSCVAEIQVETSEKCSATLITPELTTHRILELKNNRGTLYCSKFIPGPLEEIITVPVMSTSLQEVALHSCYDIISAGHQGPEKILDRLKRMTYWAGMVKATELYCRSCNVCQQSKLPMPQAVPMTNVPIGRPWQMWAEAVPMPDQTAERIVRALIDILSRFGIPEILNSDQGRNFESTILKKTCAAFGIVMSRTTSYYPHGDVRLAELRELVEFHITHEAQRQKAFYDSTTKSRTFNVGDAVWLHVPTAGKQDTRWNREWSVKEMLSSKLNNGAIKGFIVLQTIMILN